MGTKPERNLVLSASRRTELLGHFPELLAQRLEEAGPERVHSVVIWTKEVGHLLTHARVRAALSGVGQVFVQWTVTGLGGTFLEPNVPPPTQQTALAEEVVAYLGDPRRVHWRYDPLLSVRRAGERLTNLDLARFRSLAECFARAGVPAVHTSFVTPYPKVVRRFAAAGIELETQPAEEKQAFLQELGAVAAQQGMKLLTCCEPGFPRQRCIDGELLASLHPAGEPCRTDRAKGQRADCGCTASLDIGRYLPCPNRCLYCYAHPETSRTASQC